MKRRVGIHTGPSGVEEVAEKLRAAGIDATAGTETVYLVVEVSPMSKPGAAAWDAAIEFERVIGYRPATWGIREVGP
jgi:hypothetical protein